MVALAARLRRDDGQVVAFLAVGMLVILLGVAGLVVDVGHAYLVKRKLQASADAAALAGAAVLPDTAQAQAVARQFGTSGLNGLSQAGVTVTEPQPTPWCLKDVAYCYDNAPGGPPARNPAQANGLVVSESASVSTTFLKLLGVPTVTVHAKATACGLCGTQPLNIALVVDRTGSMSDNIDDLKQGLSTFGLSLNPQLDAISLLVLPPSASGNACAAAPGYQSLPLHYGDSYPTSADGGYVVAHYSTDYLLPNGQLNPSSRLVQQASCIQASGSTAYKDALVAAKAELDNAPANRAGFQKVIVFESDGAANEAPDSYYDSSSGHDVGGQTLYSATSSHTDDVARPCGSALDYANSLKAQKVIVLTVAYAVNRGDGCYQAPHITGSTRKRVNGHRVTTWEGVGYQDAAESGANAQDTLAGMASPGDAFSASDASSMSKAFAGIANKITGSSLVPDSEGP